MLLKLLSKAFLQTYTTDWPAPEQLSIPLFIIYLFHLLGNRLTVLPPQLGQLDFLSSRKILKLDNNPWVPPIEDQLILGETITISNSCLSALRTLKEFYNVILWRISDREMKWLRSACQNSFRIFEEFQ